jgi:hypothetical protein
MLAGSGRAQARSAAKKTTVEESLVLSASIFAVVRADANDRPPA